MALHVNDISIKGGGSKIVKICLGFITAYRLMISFVFIF